MRISISILTLVFSINILFAQAIKKGNLENAIDRVNNRVVSNVVDSINIIQIEKDPIEELGKDLNEIISNSDLNDTQVGILVYSLEENDFLYGLNEKKNYVPASTLKLLTTSAVLDYLGEDYRYKTEIFLDGEIQSNGEFIGDIIVRSNGDPSLSDLFDTNVEEVFAKWTDELKKHGIVSIRGNLIADDSYFEDEYYAEGWTYDDLKHSYASQVNAINLYENKVDLKISSGSNIGYLGNYDLHPVTSYVQIINNINTAKQMDDNGIEFFRDYGTNIIEIYGDIKKGNETVLEVSIDNPSLYFLNFFKEKIISSNIRFKGGLFDADNLSYEIKYTDEKKLSTHYSPKLAEIIKIVNSESNNLLAEILLKSLAKEKKGIGNFKNGVECLKEYASKVGIADFGLQIVDGSGLSRNDLFSPINFIYLLSHIYRQSYYEVFKSSLARPGNLGTLERRMLRSKAEKNVFAKTGSMSNISNLCGYVRTAENETLAFAIFMNNFTTPNAVARNIQDLICMRLSGFTRVINTKK